MISQERKELIVGALAFTLCAMFLLFAHKMNPNKMEESTYSVKASFKKADGLYEGSEVRMAGVKVGVIKKSSIDNYFNAVMVIELDKTLKLPDDSSASIETDGIFGSKYVELQPGGSEDFIKDGGFIEYTQDSLIIEELLDKIIAMGKDRQQKEKATTVPPVIEAPAQPAVVNDGQNTTQPQPVAQPVNSEQTQAKEQN